MRDSLMTHRVMSQCPVGREMNGEWCFIVCCGGGCFCVCWLDFIYGITIRFTSHWTASERIPLGFSVGMFSCFKSIRGKYTFGSLWKTKTPHRKSQTRNPLCLQRIFNSGGKNAYYLNPVVGSHWLWRADMRMCCSAWRYLYSKCNHPNEAHFSVHYNLGISRWEGGCKW